MKTSQFTILLMVVLFSLTTAYKIGSKYEQSNKKENSRTRQEIVKTSVYKEHKDSGTSGRLSFFKSNITNKNSNKQKLYKRKYDECYHILYVIESYMSSEQFNSSLNLCSYNIKEYLENIERFQNCYPENNLSYALETEIYRHCMVDDESNLCPMTRMIND